MYLQKIVTLRHIRAIPTYRVYRLHDVNIKINT
jgi:hypothetical protein